MLTTVQILSVHTVLFSLYYYYYCYFHTVIILYQNERLGYIQSQWRDGKLLDGFVTDHSLTATEIHKLSLGVVQAVCNLHRSNFVHGEITPMSIIVHEGCDVSLLVPDFSKPLVSKSYSISNHMWGCYLQQA